MSTKMLSRARTKRMGVMLSFVAALAGCSSADEGSDNAIKFGLILPFTGNTSATAANLERAAIYAVDRINEGGGLKGRPVELVARDTHSDVTRSRPSAVELVAEGAAVVFGPESPEIAAEIGPYFDAHDVLFLSPMIGASTEPNGECPTPWYRLAPSAKSLGEALAREVITSGVDSVGIVYAAGAYNEALSEAVARRLAAGGRVQLTLELDPDAQSYTAEVEDALASGVEALVLATSPRAAALFVNETDALGGRSLRWFLSPLLKTDLLVQNVAPAALEGAVGVAPQIFHRSDDGFPQAFAGRWLGDQPLEGAYFYYDAVALAAFAIEKAESEPGQLPDFADLESAMIDAASTQGESRGWNQLETGLRRIREGADVNYSGLTGPILLDECGSRRSGESESFRVTGGRIVD